jgi:hypothetical protein
LNEEECVPREKWDSEQEETGRYGGVRCKRRLQIGGDNGEVIDVYSGGCPFGSGEEGNELD